MKMLDFHNTLANPDLRRKWQLLWYVYIGVKKHVLLCHWKWKN